MQKTAALLRFDLKLINCEKFIRALNNIACIALPSAILILTDKLIIVIRRALIVAIRPVYCFYRSRELKKFLSRALGKMRLIKKR